MTEAKDTEALLAMCDEDAVFLPSSGEPIRGKAGVERMYRLVFTHYRQVSQNAMIEEVQVAGDWAFLWGTDDMRLTPEAGATLHMRGHGFSVLKRQADGTWRFWRGINNMTQQSA